MHLPNWVRNLIFCTKEKKVVEHGANHACFLRDTNAALPYVNSSQPPSSAVSSRPARALHHINTLRIFTSLYPTVSLPISHKHTLHSLIHTHLCVSLSLYICSWLVSISWAYKGAKGKPLDSDSLPL